MRKTTIAALALLSGATAQTTAKPTVDLFLVNFDTQPLVASIIASDATATTYSIACATPGDSNCGCPPAFTFTQGPSTMRYSFTETDSPPVTDIFEIGCVITSASVAACTNTRHANSATLSTSSTQTSTLSGSDLGLQPVTITAGVLRGASTASATSSTTSTVQSSSKASSSPSSQSTGSSTASASKTDSSAAGTITPPSSSGTAAAVSSSHSSTSNGAAPMITGRAQWIVGGAAAALALAVL